jgi:broad specificity phosphatase PhoE
MGIVPIYVWGHFQTADNRDGLIARSEKSVLPEVIEERTIQLRRMQDQDPYFMEKFLRLFRMFKVVYCPTTVRHAESAKLLCELFKLPAPIPDARLNPIDYGEYKGQPMSSLAQPHNYIDVPYPGGESWLACLARWRSFFEAVIPAYDGHPVMLAGQPRAAVRMCAHLCDGMALNEAVDLELTDPNVPWVYFYKFSGD